MRPKDSGKNEPLKSHQIGVLTDFPLKPAKRIAGSSPVHPAIYSL